MRFVTLIRSAKSSGVSEKRKRRETVCSDCESLFNPSFFFSPSLSVASLMLIRLFVLFCIYFLFFFRNLLSRFSHKGSQVLILLFLSSAP